MMEAVFVYAALKAAGLKAAGAAGSAAGGSGLKFIVAKLYDRAGRAEADVVGMACIRAIAGSQPLDAHGDEESWTQIGKRFIAPFADKKVASRVLDALTADPDNDDAIRATLDEALKARGSWRQRLQAWWRRRRALSHDRGADYISELATELGFNAEQFLFLFPFTVIDELCMAGAKKGSPLFERAQLTRQGQIVSRISANRLPPLSPADLKVQLIEFLTKEDEWHRRMIAQLPFMPRGADPASLGIEIMCRISTRRRFTDATGGVPRTTAGGGTSKSHSTMTMSSLLAAHPLVVTLADPGMGKTWLCHTHAAELARQAREQLQTTPQTPLSDITIAAATRCASLAERDTRDLAEAVGLELADRHRLGPALRHWLTAHLQTTACVFLLDALDEATPTRRERVLDMVADRTIEPSSVRIVITSRTASYQGLRGTADFTEADLQPFRHEDIEVYVRAWGLGADESLRQALQRPRLAAMARVPLLLAFLCHLAAGTDPLPTTQARLYDRIIRRFLQSEHRDAPPERPDDYFSGGPTEREQRLRQILRPVAFAFASAPQGWAEQMSSQNILTVLQDPSTLLPSGVDAPKALAELSVRAGVLVRAGDVREGADPPYLFIHRGFAEYLVAEYLAGGPSRLAKFIDDNGWISPDWQHVWVLLGPLLTDPTTMLERLLTLQADPLHLALFMAASLITEIRPPNRNGAQQQIDEIARRLVDLLKTPARFEAAERLAAIADCKPEDAVPNLLKFIGEPYGDLYVETPSGYGVLAEREAELMQRAAGRMAAILAIASWPGDEVDMALVKALTDRVVGVRSAAVDVLQQRAGNEATECLLDALRDRGFPARHLAAEALSTRTGDAVTDALIVALRDDSDVLREYAAQALKDRPGDAVTDALVSAFRSESDPLVAAYVATSLQDRPGRQVTETLLDAVISVEAPHDVRLTAAWSLRDRPDRAITDALLATLHDCTDPQTRWYLLRALATRPGQDVTDALLHALTSGEEDSHARRVQALELRDRPEPKVTAALREALKDPDMTVRRSAAGALTDRLEPSITDALLEALDDDEPDVRKSAVEALSSREDPRVTAKLVDALDDPDYDVAAAAAQALSGQQTREVTEALIKALTADTDTESVPTHALWRRPFVRSAAATALAAHPGLSVTNGLLSAATDHASGVRQAAVTALRGRRGGAATTALLNALSDRERLVRNAAVQSLRDRTGPEITLWLHSQADNVAVEPSLLYAVAANASRLWATWPRDNRNELLSAIAHVTEAVTAPDRRT